MAPFASWYRRYYLLVNVPLLLLITELVVARADLAHRLPFDSDDLGAAFQRASARPPDGKPVIVLAGNSAVREGIDQTRIEAELGNAVRVYNFGLSAARVDDMFDLIELLHERGIDPATVVIGVNAFLVDDQVNPDTIYPWVKRRSPYLYFHRSRIRTSIMRSVAYLFAGATKRPELAERWDWQEQFKCNRGGDESIDVATRKFVAEIGERTPAELPLIARLDELDSWLRARHITPYFVVMPMNPVATRVTPGYPAILRAIRERLPEASTLDVANDCSADQFHDVGHVNADGRAKLTSTIASWLGARR